jgi:hypothetical protein
MNAITPAEFEFLKVQAEVLACSRFAQNLSPADIVYAHLSIGRARGWSIAQTLQNIHVMRGNKISEHATVQWADVMASGLIEDLEYIEWSPNRVACRVQRRGLAPMTFEWTMEKARRANLNNSQTWKQYPERMLAARLHTEVASVLFPDVVTATSGANTYSTEEAAHFSGSREDEAKLADVVEVQELAPTEESPSAPPAPAPAPAPALAPTPRPDPIAERLIRRIRLEAEERGIDPDRFFAFLEERGETPPLLPADVHDICERYLDERSEFDAWAAR